MSRIYEGNIIDFMVENQGTVAAWQLLHWVSLTSSFSPLTLLIDENWYSS